jgi:HK97 family phage major capsid protein
MNWPQLIEQQRDTVNNIRMERNVSMRQLDQLRLEQAPDPQQIESVRAAIARASDRLRRHEEELETYLRLQGEDAEYDRRALERHPGAQAPHDGREFSFAGGGNAHTQSRSRTYNEGNKQEFLRDLYAFSVGRAGGSVQARLDKHEQEARAAGQYREERAMTSPAFAGVIPPQYLIDQYALVARSGRPVANVVQRLPLPASGMSLIIPRGTTGAAVGQQTAENTALTTQDEAWNNVTVPVVTAGGYNDVSRQSLERGGIVDEIVFGDLIGAYAANLDQQVISGTGASGQALGIFNTAGINQASAYTAAVTAASLNLKLSGAMNLVETTRLLAPNIILMHTRRWNWLLNQNDSQGRPLITPTIAGPINALGVTGAPVDNNLIQPAGTLLNMPVITDVNMPTGIGTGPEDQAAVIRREDLLLWEDPAAPFTLSFEQPVGQNLSVRLVAYGYFAFTAGRFPTAVGVTGGNSAAGFGQVAPTF